MMVGNLLDVQAGLRQDLIRTLLVSAFRLGQGAEYYLTGFLLPADSRLEVNIESVLHYRRL